MENKNMNNEMVNDIIKYLKNVIKNEHTLMLEETECGGDEVNESVDILLSRIEEQISKIETIHKRINDMDQWSLGYDPSAGTILLKEKNSIINEGRQ